MPQSSLETTELVIRTMGDVAIENRKYYSELDGVVGDGDFGNSIATGFEAVTVTKWDDLSRSSPGDFLKDVAQTFMGSVGGVSGSIWGTGFLRAGIKAGNKQDLTTDDLLAMLWFAIEGMKKRGKADIGDKTLLDGFIPATEAFQNALSEEMTLLKHSNGRQWWLARKPKKLSPGLQNAAVLRTQESAVGTHTMQDPLLLLTWRKG